MNILNWFCSLFNTPIEPRAMPNTGFIQSPADPNDSIFEADLVASTGVPFFKTDITALPTLNQKFQPSCIAHAVTFYVMWLYWRKTGKVVKLSPRFLYAICKTKDGLPNVEGTFFRVALQIAKETGICEDRFFPNNVLLDKDTYKNASLIPQSAYNNALNYRISDFHPVKDTSFMGLFQATFQKSLCLMGMRISSEWWETEDGKISWSADDLMPLRPPDPQHPIVSGHATVLYASGQNLQYLQNSWSDSWGFKGHGWYGRADIPFIFEAWIIDGLI